MSCSSHRQYNKTQTRSRLEQVETIENMFKTKDKANTTNPVTMGCCSIGLEIWRPKPSMIGSSTNRGQSDKMGHKRTQTALSRMHDGRKNFKQRALAAPGYLEGRYALKWRAISGVKRSTVANPQERRKRASNDQVAIQFKCCSHTLDLSKRTFRDAPAQKTIRVWASVGPTQIDDNYQHTLRRPGKKNNQPTRETIREVSGITGAGINDGLNIKEVLRVFDKYKLKLGVFAVF